MDKIELEKYVEKGLSIRQLEKQFNKSNGSIRYWLKVFKFKTRGNLPKSQWSKEFILSSIRDSKSISDVLRNMNLKTSPGNFDTLKKYSIKYKIKLPIYDNSSAKSNGFVRVLTDEQVFCEDSEIDRSTVKRRLIKEGKGVNCEICSISDWNGFKLSLILDHINGINNDNRRDNLRFVCPNCNSLLDTHCSKNKKPQ